MGHSPGFGALPFAVGARKRPRLVQEDDAADTTSRGAVSECQITCNAAA